jgi:ankyrin repeat protein
MNRLNWSAIHWACWTGCSEKVFELILKITKRHKEHDNSGYYLAHIACMKNSAAGIYHLKQLCESGVESGKHSIDAAALTPLMLACRSRRVDLVRYLLSCGVDYRAADSYGWEAIHHAIACDQVSILELFAELEVNWQRKIDVVVQKSAHVKCNVLHLALLVSKQPTTIQWILYHSLVNNINEFNGRGDSALHLASRFSSVQVVEELVSAGANVEQNSFAGLRPIHFAILSGRKDIVKALLSHGCSLEVDTNGFSIELHALRARQPDVIPLLRDFAPRMVLLGIVIPELLYLGGTDTVMKR